MHFLPLQCREIYSAALLSNSHEYTMTAGKWRLMQKSSASEIERMEELHKHFSFPYNIAFLDAALKLYCYLTMDIIFNQIYKIFGSTKNKHG